MVNLILYFQCQITWFLFVLSQQILLKSTYLHIVFRHTFNKKLEVRPRMHVARIVDATLILTEITSPSLSHYTLPIYMDG